MGYSDVDVGPEHVLTTVLLASIADDRVETLSDNVAVDEDWKLAAIDFQFDNMLDDGRGDHLFLFLAVVELYFDEGEFEVAE